MPVRISLVIIVFSPLTGQLKLETGDAADASTGRV
jgi:hypothetical protein